MDTKQIKRSVSYIPDHWLGFPAQREYLLGLVDNDAKLYRVLLHLVESAIRRAEDPEDYLFEIKVPIPRDTWCNHFGGYALRDKLIELGLITQTGYNPDEGRCRKYSPKPYIVREFLRVGYLSPLGTPSINLVTGKQIRRKRAHKVRPELLRKLKDDPRMAYQAWAIRYFRGQRVPFNKTALLQVIEQLYRSVCVEGKPNNRHRWLSAMAAYRAIQHGNPRPCPSLGPDVWTYTANYHPSSTGRLHELAGGLQAAPRECKFAAFDGIKGVVNFDLRSAQAVALDTVVGKLNQARGYRMEQGYSVTLHDSIDNTWLRDYSNTSGASAKYAAKLHISKDLWKKCLYAVIFGSKGNALQKAVEADHSVADKLRTYMAIRKELSPLRKMIKQVEDRLLDIISSPKGWPVAKFCRVYAGSITNAAGATLRVLDAAGKLMPGVAVRHVTLHVLQGLEAQLITETIRELEVENVVKAVSGQFDGMVCYGECLDNEQVEKIVEKAFCVAREKSIMRKAAKLEVKPFINPDESDLLKTLKIVGANDNDDSKRISQPTQSSAESSEHQEQGEGTIVPSPRHARNRGIVTSGDQHRKTSSDMHSRRFLAVHHRSAHQRCQGRKSMTHEISTSSKPSSQQEQSVATSCYHHNRVVCNSPHRLTPIEAARSFAPFCSIHKGKINLHLINRPEKGLIRDHLSSVASTIDGS